MNLAPFPLFLVLFSGLCWTIVYIASIHLGLKDSTYAMPFWALALNFAWELLQTVLEYRVAGFVLQVGITALWLLLDCGLSAKPSHVGSLYRYAGESWEQRRTEPYDRRQQVAGYSGSDYSFLPSWCAWFQWPKLTDPGDGLVLLTV